MATTTEQYVFPEMAFLSELGFTHEVVRAAKFGRWGEEYRKGRKGSFDKPHLTITLYPNWNSNTEEGRKFLELNAAAREYGYGIGVVASKYGMTESEIGVWKAPKTIPRAESVDLVIFPYPSEFFNETGLWPTHKNVSPANAAEIVKEYVAGHKNAVDKLN